MSALIDISFILFQSLGNSIEDLLPYPDRKANDDVTNYSEILSESLMENVSERTCLLGQCSREQRKACIDSLRDYTSSSLNTDYSLLNDRESETSAAKQMMIEYQSVQHLLLLLPLIFSMFVVSVKEVKSILSKSFAAEKKALAYFVLSIM